MPRLNGPLLAPGQRHRVRHNLLPRLCHHDGTGLGRSARLVRVLAAAPVPVWMPQGRVTMMMSR